MSATRDEDCLTTGEALAFLRDVLGMASPEEQLKTDREAFLGEFMRAMLHHMPFQTIRTISTPQRDRHLPTLDDIKRDMSAKFGGRCYHLNSFSWLVLRALGYNVSLMTCDLRQHKNVHVALLVHDLTSKGSKHLVDVGNAYPTFHPIPLHDFADVSPEYHHSYLRYRFVREGSSVIVRQHWIESDPARREEFGEWSKDGWYFYFYMHVDKPVDHAHFQHVMGRMYTDAHNGMTPFLRSARSVAYPDGRWVCIKDTTLLVEDSEGKVHKSYFRSLQELLDAYARYFPQFPPDMVKSALQDENVKLDFNK